LKRILGLDYGEKRIGLSLSDPSKLIATPYKTLENRGINFFLNDIKKIIHHKSIDYIVLGLPLGINGEDTIQTKKVRKFKSEISVLNLKIYFEDERMSSISAMNSMKIEKIKTGHNKEIIDRRAAAIILQQFLDKKKILK
tara:strand:+ start:113 stop:532 length:420 start_codon:yes stop_codon:yes gene_type:complete